MSRDSERVWRDSERMRRHSEPMSRDIERVRRDSDGCGATADGCGATAYGSAGVPRKNRPNLKSKTRFAAPYLWRAERGAPTGPRGGGSDLVVSPARRSRSHLEHVPVHHTTVRR